MNNTFFASIIILAPLMFGQAALANSQAATAPHTEQQLITQEMTKADILETAQGYQVAHSERAQPRRSALFAQILDTVAQSSTMAQAAKTSDASEG
ncbi:hypothetical protein [Leucothrix pacifica]|uniref:DUF4148 domain-containing protein n=1 Tax=Leucothrix pacifica TaxID=1247513 RepID=A0A317CAS8_9GAMM|nr:hypothetical protein [Leucothrix pacifica]PWQ95477.1 hypothetical protein DKW60_14775 [Leucothrix pacifica]